MDRVAFGRELRRLRRDAGLSLKRFARQVHYTPGYLSKIENGHKPATPTLINACERVLHAHGQLASIADIAPAAGQEDISHAPLFPPGQWEPDSVSRHAYRMTEFDLTLRRRDVLVGGAAVLAGPALVNPLQHWLLPLAPAPVGRGGLSDEEVTAIESGVRFIRQWARQHNGGVARKAVIAQLNEVSDRLHSTRAGTLRQRAFLAAAQLARLVASLAWDSAEHAQAQRYYVLAVQFAHVAADSGYAALALADLARQSLDLGRARDALELIQLAQYGSRSSATLTLRSFLATREAWAHAQLSQGRDFERAADQAETFFADSTDADIPHWLATFDEAELLGVLGARYRDMASTDRRYACRAITYIERALVIRDVSRIRNRTFDLISLARTYLILGEPEQACAIARQAVDLTSGGLNGRPKRKLQEFYEELSPYHRTATGRAFIEYVPWLVN
jgi:Helix-turn-helix domain